MGSIPLRIRFNKINRFIKFMMELDIKHYLVICMIKFVIGLIILLVKKGVLQIVLPIILQQSKLIHIILNLLKKY